MGRRRCGRALPFFGAPPIVCTIGLRSAEGGGRWSCLTLSVRACVCVCVRACLSVCLSPMGLWRPAKGRDRSKGSMKQHGHVGWGTFPASPTLVPFWGKNG